jgi:hypothetical protein
MLIIPCPKRHVRYPDSQTGSTGRFLDIFSGDDFVRGFRDVAKVKRKTPLIWWSKDQYQTKEEAPRTLGRFVTRRPWTALESHVVVDGKRCKGGRWCWYADNPISHVETKFF